MDPCSVMNARRSIDDATPNDWNRSSAAIRAKAASGWPLDEEAPRADLGRKYDLDKPQYSLVPKGTLREVVEVLTYGARKYSPDNWMHVAGADTRYYDAAMRHLEAYRDGEKKDPETGKSHLAHAVCCLLFMMWFDNKGISK